MKAAHECAYIKGKLVKRCGFQLDRCVGIRLHNVRIPSQLKTESPPKGWTFCFGRSVGIRTRGLLDPNQARYQTSPHPVKPSYYNEICFLCQALLPEKCIVNANSLYLCLNFVDICNKIC